MVAEYKSKSVILKRTLQREVKVRLRNLSKGQTQEKKEAENKIKELVNERERKQILEMLRERHQTEERNLKHQLKLKQDVEMEKLRKELSVSKRFALKEAQNRLLQDLIKEARVNDDQAAALMKEHLQNVAAVDKALDDQKARQVMALEMRLAQRRALVERKAEEDLHNKRLLNTLEEQHTENVEQLARSAKLNEVDIQSYRERLRKELEGFEKKLSRDRQRQEDKLHKKLTARKQRRMDEKAREHKEQLKALRDSQDEKFEQIEIDCVATINEKQELLSKQRQEIEHIERESDQQATEELEQLQLQQSREISDHLKSFSHKMLQEMTNKGLPGNDKDEIIERHTVEVTRLEEEREEQRRRQREAVEKRLEKRRKELEKKMKEDQEEQSALRKQEEKIVGDLITSQVVMSEDERDRIMKEHEKNVVELESSLTLNKLRQRQMLEEKLAKRKKQKMENLEKKQRGEERDRDNAGKVLDQGDDIELMKKHEQEKMRLVAQQDFRMNEELEQIRAEMMVERAKVLQEHDERLGALIAQLQIEKAKQVSQIAVQQQALGRLQVGLVDEMEAKGSFNDPETQKIMDKYHKETKKVEKQLQTQREKQEQALRERLQERMQQREATLLTEQKDEMARFMEGQGANSTVMRFRKAVVKARHQKELEGMRHRMEGEINQSLRELKAATDVKRMQALEAQSVKLISALVKCGNFEEGELESVTQYLFPSKSNKELDDLLSQILGKEHTSSGTFVSRASGRRMSTLEERIIKPNHLTPISPTHSPKKQGKKKRRSKNKYDSPEKLTEPLPPVRPYRKGFNLDESLNHSPPEGVCADDRYRIQDETQEGHSERSVSPQSNDSGDEKLLRTRFRVSPGHHQRKSSRPCDR